MKIDKALQSAYQYYQAGDLNQARDIYKKVLRLKPNNIDALHFVEMICCQLGDFDEAIRCIRKEIELTPSNAELYYKLGTVLQAKGLFSEAIDYFRKAITLKPHFPDAYYNLGLALQNTGQVDEAISNYQKAIQIEPNLMEAYNNLGILLSAKGCLEESITYFQKAIRINPNHADIYNNLGLSLKEKGNIDEAIMNYKKAITLNPAFADAYYNLGFALQGKKQLDAAIDSYKKALQINPALAEVQNSVGYILAEKGQMDEAVTYFQKAITLNPNYAGAYYNLGLALQNKGQFEEAITYYQKAIDISPDYADAYYNLGNVLQNKGQFEEAITCYQNVIHLSPNFHMAYNNLGVIYTVNGQLNEAEIHLRRALQINPDLSITYSNLLFNMNYNSRYNPQDIFSEHLLFAKKFAEPLSYVIPAHTNGRQANRRLRIGYCSPDFRRHSVAYFIEPVLAARDRGHFEVFCYSNSSVIDEVTNRVQEHADQWRNIVGMSDEEVTELIRKEEIDILVDLAGHTANNRILVFTRKPSPVQVSWIGYPATTGLSSMDYKIVDAFTDPPGMTEQFYSEKLLRLPDSFLCYMPEANSPDISLLPTLVSGHITFASFNDIAKISPEVIALWSEILKEVQDSRMVMKSKGFSDGSTRQRFLTLFHQNGVDSDRLRLLPFMHSTSDHLAAYNNIDIALDTFPYNGTTTTCEAMWMGVPVITLSGCTHVSKVGVSLLSNVGLPELIAKTHDEYIATAVNLASDIEKLRLLRRSLRDRMSHSPLTDARRFTANLEMCYRKMWENWCNSTQA
ncbi:MAG: tetratricopeptide repeat protein [Nitrospirota bacterium]